MPAQREMHNKQVVLVDGSSYLFRAFHALPALTTTSGRPTGAIRGVIGMLRKLLRENPDSVTIVVLDASGPTFRHQLFPQYKANRPPLDPALRSQIDPIQEIITAMGLPLLQVPDVEADDVIGTLAKQAIAMSKSVLISTSDKDMAQLVGPNVTLIDTMNNTLLDRAGVVGKFGVPPERITDYLALTGDSSDNIPGVPGVGPKTAAKWLATYDDLDGVLANQQQIKGKIGESLRAVAAQLPLSKDLATIRRDLRLPDNLDSLHPEPVDRARLLQLFRELEFKIWSQEIGTDEDKPAAHYQTITTEDGLDTWIRKLTDAPVFSLDTETTSLDYMQARLVGVSFAVEPGEAAYVPVGHDYPDHPPQLPMARVLAALRPLIEDPERTIIGQNLKYDMSVLARHGIVWRARMLDTMLESYVLDSTGSNHGMDTLALKFLGRDTIHFEDIAGRGAQQLGFNQIPLEKAAPYASEDADVTLQLHQKLYPKLQAEPGLLSLFERIEIPLIPVLSAIERHGAMVDGDFLRQQSVTLKRQTQELEIRARELGEEDDFNLSSPKQLAAILYDKLGLPVLRKTPKGAPSTAEHVLIDLAMEHELPQIILQYRSMTKLKSTYTDQLPQRINSDTGRIHTSYHQAVASTGRLSSSDPNLQNIPIRTPEGRRIRQAFVAPKGKKLLTADYSQIELRIMAHLSGDLGLVQAFRQGLDVHRATASELHDVAIEAVTMDQRRNAKAVNFGLMYGMSAFGLARQLHIPQRAAQDYIDRYFERYPGVRAFMDRIRHNAGTNGYVETLFGRRLYLPDIHSAQVARRQAAQRSAINAPMQGTAADIIKLAMIAVHNWLAEAGLDAAMIMQVHDELVFEVAPADIDALTRGVVDRMTMVAELDIPLIVDTGVGANWDEAH